MYYQDPLSNGELAPPQDQAGALAWVRERWDAFTALSPKIIDLQHRAALAAKAYREMGKSEQADAARMIIEQLAKLQNVHHKILTWAEQAAGAVGLGAIQIPIGLVGITVVALLVAWAFRKYEAQREALELLEAGVLTPETFKALDILDPPGIASEIAGVAGGIGKWILLIILGFAVVEAIRRNAFFGQNPPLVMFGNPPGIMSEDVVLIGYRHADDGQYYIHEFEGGVEMDALPDGALEISHPGKEIWREF